MKFRGQILAYTRTYYVTSNDAYAFYKIINIVCCQNIIDQLLTNSNISKMFQKTLMQRLKR